MTWRRAAFVGAVFPAAVIGAVSPMHRADLASIDLQPFVRSPEQAVFSKDTLTFEYEVSGLRVIQRVRTATDVVAVRLYLLGGCQLLSRQTAGIEALWLTASAFGTEHFPGELTQRAMARTGSREVLEPLADWTVFGFTGLREELAATWEVFADQLMLPTLGEAIVSRARALLISEAERRAADPEWRVQAMAVEVTFAGHPYALNPEGTTTSLAALTPEAVAAYARNHLVTSRLVLVVVGNVERAELEPLVASTLGRLPPGDYQWTLPPPIAERQGQWLVQHRPAPTNYILAYIPGPAATDHDYAAFRVAISVLSGQLQTTIRDERGLSYAVYAPFLDRAVAVGGLYASTPAPEQVVPIMMNEINQLQSGLVTRISLSRFIDGYILQYLTENATNAGQADMLARAQILLGDYRLAGDYMKRLQAVRPQDVHQAALRYMSHAQYAYLGDTTRMSGVWLAPPQGYGSR